MYKVAINGFGRIGRNVLRAHYEYAAHNDIQIVVFLFFLVILNTREGVKDI